MMRWKAGLGILTAIVSGVSSVAAAQVDFEIDVRPILEMACVSCHRADEAEGGLRLDSRDAMQEGGDSGAALEPGMPDESLLLVRATLDADDGELMPPPDAGGPLPQAEVETLRAWIAQGAAWPADAKLQPRARIVHDPSPDDLQLVRRIRDKIVAQAAEAAEELSDYEGEIPLTQVPYAMVAVPGGEFAMGSPPDEAKRRPNEGPAAHVAVDAFWIGKYEITWDQYEPFMVTQVDRYKNGARKDYDAASHTLVDAVSQPTAPYMEMSFGMGQKGYPAISMTQHAANKFCQWLSAQTGRFYRLPTEAEWEYACRAGTATAYCFGNDLELLGEYAWYYDNSDEKYQKVGLKKPNAWGIHDMHGNVREWTADQYLDDYFARLGGDAANPFVKPQTLYPRTVRGGGWDDDPDRLRSAARQGSEAIWKQQDPQLPKSIWYHTDAQWLGFRIVRPKEIPTAEEMWFYWNSAADKL
ncbi:MAG: SUMF1/EgtB/PvdO family nonheme iron enzyme [Planctomycetales bacterium]|nr:SUMF1/EgtB/PvdO family nonheme iron enzyme [Planctomycetales bacterium]